MQQILGWILVILGGGLYVAQIISSVNFTLAQRLGIQENPKMADNILQRAERYTAYWDLVTLIWLPISGILMLVDNHWWPIVSLLAGAICLDTSGREAVKNLSFRHEGLKVGTAFEQQVYFSSYIIMAITALTVIAYSIYSLAKLIC